MARIRELDLEKNREYQRKWYAANRETQNARVRANQKRYTQEVRELVFRYKSNGCSRCPEKHIATLDFHHLDPKEKELSINKAIARHWSLARVEKEIKKCIVLCSNCHRIEHYEQRLTRIV